MSYDDGFRRIMVRDESGLSVIALRVDPELAPGEVDVDVSEFSGPEWSRTRTAPIPLYDMQLIAELSEIAANAHKLK